MGCHEIAQKTPSFEGRIYAQSKCKIFNANKSLQENNLPRDNCQLISANKVLLKIICQGISAN